MERFIVKVEFEVNNRTLVGRLEVRYNDAGCIELEQIGGDCVPANLLSEIVLTDRYFKSIRSDALKRAHPLIGRWGVFKGSRNYGSPHTEKFSVSDPTFEDRSTPTEYLFFEERQDGSFYQEHVLVTKLVWGTKVLGIFADAEVNMLLDAAHFIKTHNPFVGKFWVDGDVVTEKLRDICNQGECLPAEKRWDSDYVCRSRA